MIVPVPNLLSDAWDASPSFAVAFCDTYEAVTQGFDRAVANGTLDLHPDDDAESSDLQRGLARGEALDGATVLATRYGVARSTVYRVAGEMGVTVFSKLATQKQFAWDLFVTTGETRPRVVLAKIAYAFPGGKLPTRRTLQQWGAEFRSTV